MAASISSLYAFLLRLLLLCSLKKAEGSFPQTHTLEVSSLLESDICDRSPRVFDQGSSFQVHFDNGACNGLDRERGGAKLPAYIEMLLQDKLRAGYIQVKARLSNKNSFTGVFVKDSVPTQTGRALGIGTARYVVSMGLGTPAKKLSFLFDTVSDLTWTQCEPCVTSCHQKDPRFDPAASTSYKNVSCSSESCGLINGGGQKSCSASTCHYEYQLSNKYLSGFLATETLTIGKSQVFENFLFGCGQKNQGPFGRASGILALGRSNLSLPSQTAGKYKGLFSYCLPTTYKKTGHLTFGGNIPNGVKFTPTKDDSLASFYSLDMTGVSVGGRMLPIDDSFFEEAGTIIDPGSLVSHLPPTVYSSLTRAFEELMTDYPRVDGYADFRTCYDLSGQDTVTVPTISFYFKGGVEVAVHNSGILMGRSLKKACLAFASNLEDGDLGILGSLQQRTYEVVYDVAKGRVGFSPGGCN